MTQRLRNQGSSDSIVARMLLERGSFCGRGTTLPATGPALTFTELSIQWVERIFRRS
jgi:hypothetical protein